ncbi:MAG TPA: PPOX class F420-dependent oxidoreductase [Ktedonobacterales bacterium]
MMFSEQELAYLREQILARLATVDDEDQPTVDAVGFEFDGTCFIVGGRNLEATRKYKNIATGHVKVSLIVDDLQSIRPWRPRGIKIHGYAEIDQREGRFGAGDYLAITPQISWSWGVHEQEPGQGVFTPRRTIWGSDGK